MSSNSKNTIEVYRKSIHLKDNSKQDGEQKKEKQMTVEEIIGKSYKLCLMYYSSSSQTIKIGVKAANLTKIEKFNEKLK